MNELDTSLNKIIHDLSEYTDDEIASLMLKIERAYTHVMIERELRKSA